MKNILAINYWVLGGFTGELPCDEAILKVKEYGLDGLEFTFGDSPLDTCKADELKEIAKFAEENQVKLATLATGFYWNCSLASTDEDERKKAVEFTKKYIQAASAMGINCILVTAGAIDVAWDESVPVSSYLSVWETAAVSFKELLPYAGKMNVRLAVENVWSKFLMSPIEMKMFIDQFESDYIGVYFDVGNVTAFGYAEHWIEILKEKIFAVHVKNYKRSDCLGGIHGFTDDLLEGNVNFKNVINGLEKINYKGPLTIEMIPFCRLPDLVLPDHKLAKDSAEKFISVFKD